MSDVMRGSKARSPRHPRGVTIIELVVALGIFALFILLIDAVFFGANRSARKAELAADVQQNARIAAERVTRELRESNVAQVSVGGSAGSMAVVFKSARLNEDNSVFCLYARSTTDPVWVYDTRCFTFSGGNITPPDYGAPPYGAGCHATKLAPCGTYSVIWQRYVGYYVVDIGGGVKELRRVVQQLDTPAAALPDPTTLSGGEVIASHVETFDVAISGTNVTVTLKAKGVQVVQGTQLPVQEVLLPAQVFFRN
jgi:type II secretory pathway pseudopilin PulG